MLDTACFLFRFGGIDTDRHQELLEKKLPGIDFLRDLSSGRRQCDKAAAVPTGNSQVVSTQDDSSSLSASLQTGAPIELNSDPFAVKQREGRSAGTTNYWWMKATGVFDAWKIQESSASVTVAVLDTGCDVSHKDLSAGQIVGQWNVVDKTITWPTR